MRLWWSGEVNSGGSLKPMNLGFEHASEKVKAKCTVSTSLEAPNLLLNAVWRCCPTTSFGAQIEGGLKTITKSNKFGIVGASGFDKDSGAQVGGSYTGSLDNGSLKDQQWAFYFNHATAANVVGAKITYGHDKKEWGALLGMKF